MAIFGMGTDMIAIARVETSLARGNGLVRRVLTEYEQDIWAQHRAPADYLAKRFAAKEAFAKALGTGFRHNLNFKDIIIKNDKAGKPMISLNKKITLFLKKNFSSKNFKIFLSLSDEDHYSIAYVIISEIRS